MTEAVMAFGDTGDMLAFLSGQHEALNARVKPWQRNIGSGNRFMMRFYVEPNDDDTLFIYTEIPADWEEIFAKNYPERFMAMHYSQIVPSGESGSIHIAEVDALLTADQFSRCKAAGWPNSWEAFLRAAYRIPSQKAVCIPYTRDSKFCVNGKDSTLIHAVIKGNVPHVGSERQFNSSEGVDRWTIVNDWIFATTGSNGHGSIEWMGHGE